jgi:hypothetical protein
MKKNAEKTHFFLDTAEKEYYHNGMRVRTRKSLEGVFL